MWIFNIIFKYCLHVSGLSETKGFQNPKLPEAFDMYERKCPLICQQITLTDQGLLHKVVGFHHLLFA